MMTVIYLMLNFAHFSMPHPLRRERHKLSNRAKGQFNNALCDATLPLSPRLHRFLGSETIGGFLLAPSADLFIGNLDIAGTGANSPFSLATEHPRNGTARRENLERHTPIQARLKTRVQCGRSQFMAAIWNSGMFGREKSTANLYFASFR